MGAYYVANCLMEACNPEAKLISTLCDIFKSRVDIYLSMIVSTVAAGLAATICSSARWSATTRSS